MKTLSNENTVLILYITMFMKREQTIKQDDTFSSPVSMLYARITPGTMTPFLVKK